MQKMQQKLLEAFAYLIRGAKGTAREKVQGVLEVSGKKWRNCIVVYITVWLCRVC